MNVLERYQPSCQCEEVVPLHTKMNLWMLVCINGIM